MPSMFNPNQYAGPVRIPPPSMQVRVRQEVFHKDAINARHVEAWRASVPIPQGEFLTVKDNKAFTGREAFQPQAYDMAPLTSRTDRRNYRQSQPFQVNGPSLAMNPYFDRYDPTRDPRNMIREMRGVVTEDPDVDRGLEESQRLVARGYMSRWMPEGSSEEDLKMSLQAYEIMRPKMDNIQREYRGAGAPPSVDSRPFQMNTNVNGQQRTASYQAPVLTELPKIG